MKSNVDAALCFPGAKDFENRLSDIVSEGSGVVIVMLDVDKFFTVNESFGRDEGDRVLIEAGKYAASALGNSGVIYRYGGDEFAIIFNDGTEREAAFLTMENIRTSFPVRLPDGTPVTVSAGIAATPDDGATVAELIRKAEGALFRAKLGGRNRVCLAREEKMVTKTAHFTTDQLQRLTKLSKRDVVGEAILLREALDDLLRKYDV